MNRNILFLYLSVIKLDNNEKISKTIYRKRIRRIL